MKKIIIFLALVMISGFALPQGYHKLIRTNTTWDEFMVIEPEIWCYTSADRIFFTDEDTVINGLTYRISRMQTIHQLNQVAFCPPFVADTTSFLTDQFLREDTIAKKVYIYTPGYGGGTEQLIYDFSLLPGDTLKSSYTGMGLTLVLDSIHDYQLENGETRKQFYFGSSLGMNFYMEGIGGSQGLFRAIVPGLEFYGGYLCVKENSIDLFGNQCDIGYVGQNELDRNTVTVYPNPASNLLKVVIPESAEPGDFRILNMHGQEIFNHNLVPGSNSFSVSEITPGVYFYQVKSNKSFYNGKLLIY